MKFSIITPTYQRSHLLERAIKSVLSQNQSWEMIIVNDSPDDKSYETLIDNFEHDVRIRYFVNDENRGVNYSRNRALNLVAPDSTHVIFLDDDDYFSPQALLIMADGLRSNTAIKWLVTNRASADGKIRTSAPASDVFYNYARDYLIGRRVKGDATHCIAFEEIKQIRFSARIRQAEEWLFYLELGRNCDFYYKDSDTTYSDGYSPIGLNSRRRTFGTELQVLISLFKEAGQRHFLAYPSFYIYYAMRLARLILRR